MSATATTRSPTPPEHLLADLVLGRKLLAKRAEERARAGPPEGGEFEAHWLALRRAAQAELGVLAAYCDWRVPAAWHHKATDWILVLDVPAIGRVAAHFAVTPDGWVSRPFGPGGWWGVVTYRATLDRWRWVVVPAATHDWLQAQTRMEALALAEQQLRLRYALEADVARKNGDLP